MSEQDWRNPFESGDEMDLDPPNKAEESRNVGSLKLADLSLGGSQEITSINTKRRERSSDEEEESRPKSLRERRLGKTPSLILPGREEGASSAPLPVTGGILSRRKKRKTAPNLSQLSIATTPSPVQFQKRPEKTSRDLLREEAIAVLLEESEIVCHSFFDRREDFERVYQNLERGGKEAFLMAKLSGGSTMTSIINDAFSKKATLDKVREMWGGDFEYRLSNKIAGKNRGFVVDVTDGEKSLMRYYAKDFMDTKTSEKRKSNEFFVYKLLEILGFGPKAHFACYKGKSPTIITESLDVVKIKTGHKNTVKVFNTQKDILDKNSVVFDEEYRKSDAYLRFCRDTIALEILVSMLKLSDITDNYQNSGIVTTTGAKTEGKMPKRKGKLVDFSSQVRAENQCSFENLPSFDDLRASMESGGCILPFAKEAIGATKEQYRDAIRSLLEGRELTSGTRRVCVADAVEMAFEEAQKVREQMRGSEFEEDFVLDKSPATSEEELDISSFTLKPPSNKIPEALQGVVRYKKEIEGKLEDLRRLLEEHRQKSPSPRVASPAAEETQEKKSYSTWI